MTKEDSKEKKVPQFITELAENIDMREADEKEATDFDLEQTLRKTRLLGCIRKSEDEKGLIEKVAELVQEYKNSQEDNGTGADILKLEEINKIIQGVVRKAVDEKKIYLKEGENPTNFIINALDTVFPGISTTKAARKICGEGKVVKNGVKDFGNTFEVRTSTIWDNPCEKRKHTNPFMKEHMINLDFALKLWNQFYSQERTKWEKQHTAFESKGSFPITKTLVAEFQFRVRKKLS
jgi:hypothetical protein